MLGSWLVEDRDGIIRVEPCGAALCGRIIGILKFEADGAPPRDIQGRSQCGLVIMTRMKEIRPGLWDGLITNPEDGRTWDAQMRLDQAGNLRLRGYLGIPLLGATQVWTRFDGPTPPGCRMAR